MAIQGMFAVLKYKTDGVAGVAPWTVLDSVRDLTLSVEAGEADITTRSNSGWRATLATLKEGSLEFELVWEPSNAGFNAVKNAFLTGASIGLAALDSGGAAGEGLVADFSITNFSRAEPLEEALTVSVTAKVSVFSQWTTTGVT